MSFIQKLIFRFLSEQRAEALKQESERWLVVCPNCHHQRNVWEMGGVRAYARSKGKRSGSRCPNCQAFTWAYVVYEDSPEHRDLKARLDLN